MKRFLPLIALAATTLAMLPAPALAASSPTVKLYSPSAIGNTTATLVAEITTNSSTTTYHFDYGPTSALGTAAAAGKLGGSTKAQAVKTAIAGLQPGTTYSFDLVATNASGTTTSSIGTFKTTGAAPPGATTGGASVLSNSSANVTGVITPNGATTTYFFAYGLTDSYGYQTAPDTVPAGSSPVSVAAALVGLAAGTTFHYELVVVHSGAASVVGGDQSFETFPKPAPAARLSFRVSPHHETGGPFLFTTTGSIRYSAATSPALACTGPLVVRTLYGRTQLTVQHLQLTGSCTFSLTTRLRHKPSRAAGNQVVTFEVRFEGGDYVGRSRVGFWRVSVG